MSDSTANEIQLLYHHFEASLPILNDFIGDGISFERSSSDVQSQPQIIPEDCTALKVQTNSGAVLIVLADNTSKFIASSIVGIDYSDLRDRDLDVLEMSALKDSINILFSKFIEDSNLKEYFSDCEIEVDESGQKALDSKCFELNFNCFANQIECGFLWVFIPENEKYRINPMADSMEEQDSDVEPEKSVKGFESHWVSFETYRDRGYEYKLHALKEYFVSLAILARNEGLYAIEEYLEAGPWEKCKY